ncbi:DUF3927 family protein [Escherichia coli]
MTVKLRLAAVALLLFLVVMVDFTTGRIMSVLADGVLVVGIVVVLFPLVKKDMPGS